MKNMKALSPGAGLHANPGPRQSVSAPGMKSLQSTGIGYILLGALALLCVLFVLPTLIYQPDNHELFKAFFWGICLFAVVGAGWLTHRLRSGGVSRAVAFALPVFLVFTANLLLGCYEFHQGTFLFPVSVALVFIVDLPVLLICGVLTAAVLPKSHPPPSIPASPPPSRPTSGKDPARVPSPKL